MPPVPFPAGGHRRVPSLSKSPNHHFTRMSHRKGNITRQRHASCPYVTRLGFIRPVLDSGITCWTSGSLEQLVSFSGGGGTVVCFVGNIPYDTTEEQLTEIFSTVGPVQAFRWAPTREFYLGRNLLHIRLTFVGMLSHYQTNTVLSLIVILASPKDMVTIRRWSAQLEMASWAFS